MPYSQLTCSSSVLTTVLKNLLFSPWHKSFLPWSNCLNFIISKFLWENPSKVSKSLLKLNSSVIDIEFVINVSRISELFYCSLRRRAKFPSTEDTLPGKFFESSLAEILCRCSSNCGLLIHCKSYWGTPVRDVKG